LDGAIEFNQRPKRRVPPMFKGAFEKTVVQLLDTGSRLQGPRSPSTSTESGVPTRRKGPAQIIERLEGQYCSP